MPPHLLDDALNTAFQKLPQLQSQGMQRNKKTKSQMGYEYDVSHTLGRLYQKPTQPDYNKHNDIGTSYPPPLSYMKSQ